jgi:hypothetical protein
MRLCTKQIIYEGARSEVNFKNKSSERQAIKYFNSPPMEDILLLNSAFFFRVLRYEKSRRGRHSKAKGASSQLIVRVLNIMFGIVK